MWIHCILFGITNLNRCFYCFFLFFYSSFSSPPGICKYVTTFLQSTVGIACRRRLTFVWVNTRRNLICTFIELQKENKKLNVNRKQENRNRNQKNENDDERVRGSSSFWQCMTSMFVSSYRNCIPWTDQTHTKLFHIVLRLQFVTNALQTKHHDYTFTNRTSWIEKPIHI